MYYDVLKGCPSISHLCFYGMLLVYAMQSLRLCLAKVFWHCSVESQQVLSTEKALKGYPQSSLIGEDVSWVLQTFDTCETITATLDLSDTKPTVNVLCAT